MKYPRTFHLPFSPGCTSDDKKLISVDSFLNKPVIITEKLDGSNCCLTKENVFARTHSSPAKHPSFNWIKQKHSGLKHLISNGDEVFGENCFAVHSIAYEALPSFFFCFGVRRDSLWLSWDDLLKESQRLTLPLAPFLGEFVFKDQLELKKTVESICSEPSAFGGIREGIVLRSKASFLDKDFSLNVSKWVRPNHVQTDDHWIHQPIIPQKTKAP